MLVRRPGILGLSLLCCVISGTSPNFSEPNILFFIPCHQTRSSSFTLYWRHLTLWLSVPQFLLLAAPRLHSPSSHLTVSLSFSPSFSISYSSVDLQTVGAPCTSVFNPFFCFYFLAKYWYGGRCCQVCLQNTSRLWPISTAAILVQSPSTTWLHLTPRVWLNEPQLPNQSLLRPWLQ